jgi:hypothetical protein
MTSVIMAGLLEKVPTTTTTTACPDWVDVAGVLREKKTGVDIGLNLSVGQTSTMADGPRELTIARISNAQITNGTAVVVGGLPYLTVSVPQATLEGLGGDVVVVLTTLNAAAPRFPKSYDCSLAPAPVTPALAFQLYSVGSGAVVPATDFAAQLNMSLDYKPIPIEDGVQPECGWFNRDDGTWWGGAEAQEASLQRALAEDGPFVCSTDVLGQGTSYTPEGPGKRLKQTPGSHAPQIISVFYGQNISALLATTSTTIPPEELPPEELPLMTLLIIGVAVLVGLGLPLFLVLISPICIDKHKKRLVRMHTTSKELAKSASQAALEDRPASSSQV